MLPTTTSRTYRFKGGDNLAENVFSIVKRNLTRISLSSGTANASINVLSSAWLHKNIGFDGVVKAMKINQEGIMDTCHPKDAYKKTPWLKALEPMYRYRRLCAV